MADLSEQIKALLSDPAAVAKLTAIAGNLSAGGMAAGAPTEKPASSAPVLPQKHDPRTELLKALRPFVRAEKQGQLDEVLRLMTVADLVLPILTRHGKGGGGLV